MWRKKKFLVIAVLAMVLVAGSIGGIIVAQAADATAPVNGAQPKTILTRVAEILGIDQTKLEAAVKQAQGEQQLADLKNRLQAMVAAGKITQEQADAYLTWYTSKPDTAPYQQQLKDWQNARPQIPNNQKTWQQSQPKIPGLSGPAAPNNGRGMMNGRGGINPGGMMNGRGRINPGGMMGGLNLPAGPVQ